MFRLAHIYFFTVVIACSMRFNVLAQTRNNRGTGLAISKSSAPISVDGILDEPAWKDAAVATDFFLNYPLDSLPPTFQLEHLKSKNRALVLKFILVEYIGQN